MMQIIDGQELDLTRRVYVGKSTESRSAVSFMDFSNFEMALKTAEILSKARCIPKEFWDNPADVLVIVQFGHELGLSPMASIQNMMIVNNRPSIYGDAMLAVCMKTKGQPNGFIDCIEIYDEVKQHWTCTATREGRDPKVTTFTMQEAKEAGYLSKPGAWQTNRKRMMQFRSRSFCLRDMFPDVLKGILTIEEMKDVEMQHSRTLNNELIKNTVESMKDRLKFSQEIKNIQIQEKSLDTEGD